MFIPDYPDYPVWERLCASFVVQSSTGKDFVQALQYEVVLASTLFKLCSTGSDPENRKIKMQNPSVDMQVAHENDIIRE